MSGNDFDAYCDSMFGCDTSLLLRAMDSSPSSRGYLLGAISEILLKDYLEGLGYEVLRIIEKPSGGNLAKNVEARGDFYVRKQDRTEDQWLVVESKGLKSNSEFRGGKLDSPDKVFRFLRSLAFRQQDWDRECYAKGLSTYEKVKKVWKGKNRKKKFPPFLWPKDAPGPITCDLSGLWEEESDLRAYVDSLSDEAFSEQAYRRCQGAVAVLETHKPSTRVGPITGIKQAAPLVSEFSVLAVDLYLRTGQHEFAFVNPKAISHSPTSPEHLYQNYTIDVLIPGLKTRPCFIRPWYNDFDQCVAETKPMPRKLDPTQIDDRGELT